MITRYFILAAILVGSVSGKLTSDAMAKTVSSWDDCLTKEPQRIKGPETLFPGGKIDCVRGFTLREDGTHEGSRYSVSYDGSGKIQGDRANRRAMKWFLSCVHDDIDDKHVCAILRSKFLQIGIDSEQRVYVSIGADHYPGSIVALKIDSNPPWKAPAPR